MSDFSALLLAGQDLGDDERRELSADPVPTLNTLLEKARRGTPVVSSQAVDALVALTADGWPDSVRAATIDTLIDALSGSAEVDVISALITLDDAMWPRLMDRAAARDVPAPLETVILILWRARPDETTARLITWAEDPAAELAQRKWALEGLQSLARSPQPNDPAARAALVQAAGQDGTPELQTLAVRLLTGIGALGDVVDLSHGTRPPQVRQVTADSLIDALGEAPDAGVIEAIEDLGQEGWQRLIERTLVRQISAPLGTVIPLLYRMRPADTTARWVALSRDGSAGLDLRKWALDALRVLATEPEPNDPVARAALAEIATAEPSAELQAFAVQMLTILGAGEYLDDLGELLEPDGDQALLLNVLEYLEMQGRKDALTYLHRLTGSRDLEVRYRLAVALRTIGSPDAIGTLEELLDLERETRVIREAVAALKALRRSETIPALAAVARNARVAQVLRREAIVALGDIGSEQAAQSLLQLLDELQEVWLETLVLETLERMGPIARTHLIGGVIHPNERVRQHARERLMASVADDGDSSGLAQEVLRYLLAGRSQPLDDKAAASVAQLLRNLTQQDGQEGVVEELRRLALKTKDWSAVYVLRDLVGADQLAEQFKSILQPDGGESASAENVNRAESILRLVPSEEGIKVLVQYQLARSQRDRKTRLELVTADEDGKDIFKKLRGTGVNIFEDTAAGRAKGAYWIMLVMNVASFLVTLSLTTLCFLFAFVRNPDGTNEALKLVAGGGALLGGLMTVVQARLFAPVKAVQDSVSNLAMVQMTFMGFISRLEQVRVVFQDQYLDSAFGLEELAKADAVIEDAVADALVQMNQFIQKQPDSSQNNAD